MGQILTGLRADITVEREDGFRLESRLDVNAGETAALLGPNGAGKSTALSAIAGLIPLDSGRVELAGKVLDDPGEGVFVPPSVRDIGIVFQGHLLFPHLTVLENVAFGLRARGTGAEPARAVARQWLDRVGLRGLEDRKAPDLSGGQAQRVALARALAIEPALLLLDEPMSALDVTARVDLRRALAEHLETFAGPRLLVTHDPTEAFLLADEVHVLESGVITQRGSADDIRLRPRTQYAADLAGSNLLPGTASAGSVRVASGSIHIADRSISGPVLLTIHPHSISVHLRQPEGSQRNTWMARVDVIERLGNRARLRTSGPIPVTVEITDEAVDSMGLEEGTEVWLAVKATEVGVEPQGAA